MSGFYEDVCKENERLILFLGNEVGVIEKKRKMNEEVERLSKRMDFVYESPFLKWKEETRENRGVKIRVWYSLKVGYQFSREKC